VFRYFWPERRKEANRRRSADLEKWMRVERARLSRHAATAQATDTC
jgi:hypothetical protein